MKATFKKRGLAFYAADAEAEAFLAKTPEGSRVILEGKRSRNPQHHRLMFGAANKVAENLAGGMDGHALIKCFQLITNTHVTVQKTRQGILTWPDSISFESMDQSAFDEFFKKFTAWVAKDILPGVGEQELMDEFMDMVA